MLAKVLALLVEFRINWVPLLMVRLLMAATLSAPPETIVPPRVAVLLLLPVMVAPVVNEVVPAKVTEPVFLNSGAPESKAVLLAAKLTE